MPPPPADNQQQQSANLFIRFPQIWEDFVEVSWGRQIYDGYKPLKYQLTAEGDEYRVDRYFNGDENSFRFKGLEPATTISVRIRVLVDLISTGLREHIESKWLPWAEATVTTLPSITTEPATVGSDYLHGRFCLPESDDEALDETDGGGGGSGVVDELANASSPSHLPLPAREYQIKIREKGTMRTFDVCEKTFPADCVEFTIADLRPNMVFDVQARAVSLHGDLGQWSEPVRYLTLASVKVQVIETGETFALIKWDRPVDDENPFASEAAIAEMAAVVEMKPSQRELDMDAQAKGVRVVTQSFPNETRMFRIRDLTPGRDYVIKSRYRNLLGDWAQWTTTSFSTLFPIDTPEAQLVSHNYVQVSWRRALETGGNTTPTVSEEAKLALAKKDVKQWEVRCTVGNAVTSMVLPAKELVTKLVNLHSGVDYSIDVRALIDAGEWGPWSPPLIATTLHRLLPRGESTGETWIGVSWLRKDKLYQDNITRYHLQLSAVDSTFRLAKYFPADVTSFLFEQLRPGTKFHLVVQALSDNRWGPWSEPVEVSTCASCVPTLSRRGETFVQVSWGCEYYDRSALEGNDQRFQVRLVRPVLYTEEEERLIGDGDGLKDGSIPADADFGDDTAVAHLLPPEELIKEVTLSTYRITRVPANCRVLVQVRCFDFQLHSWGSWGEEVEFKTLPHVLVVTYVGETVAEVSWTRQPQILSALNDKAILAGAEDSLAPVGTSKFILRLNQVDAAGHHHRISKIHCDSNHATTFSFASLSPDSVYSVQLSYCDASGTWSPDSAPVRFRTAPPLQVSVLDIAEGQATLHWGRWVKGITPLEVPEVHFRIVVEQVDEPNSAPLEYSVSNTNSYAITGLSHSTLYKVCISAGMRAESHFGTWSEAVYFLTSAAMVVSLQAIGEDYASVSWVRGESALTSFPNARVRVANSGPEVLTDVAKGKADSLTAPERSNHQEGNPIFSGNNTALEYHIQISRLRPADHDPTLRESELVFDAKVHSSQSAIKVPSLEPDTTYIAMISACSQTRKWGSWSAPLEFTTAMPTTVYVSEITPEAVTVRWGVLGSTDGAPDSEISRYQLRIDGVDDVYHDEQELDSECTHYKIKGLSLGCCYTISMRTHLKTEHDWGTWSKPTYLAVQSVPVDVVEYAQNWVHLAWKNTFRPDHYVKAQFLSLVGSGTASVTAVPHTESHYTFTDLEPSSKYSAHLVTIQQLPYAIKAEDSIPSHLRGGLNPKSVLSDKSATTTFSLPLVASDFSRYIEDGFAFQTRRRLKVTAECIGQTFVLLHWKAKEADDGTTPDLSAAISQDSTFEIETVCGDARTVTKTRGGMALVRNLTPGSSLRCAVRWVPQKSTEECEWSRPIPVSLLPEIEPLLGVETATDVPGIGEDYLMYHWTRSIRNSNLSNRSDVTFEAKLRYLVGKKTGDEILETTLVPSVHFKGLKPATRYQVQVRTSITVDLGGVKEVIKGSWSPPLISTTLSPIQAAAMDVTETSAHISWSRTVASSSARGGGGSQEEEGMMAGVDGDRPSGITSFHVRVSKVDSDTGDVANVVQDEQFTAGSTEFAAKCWAVRGLKPGGRYAASVRASTGLLWGVWSDSSFFSTNVPCTGSVRFVADTFLALEWSRPEYTGGGTLPPLHCWEVKFSALGSSRSDASGEGGSSSVSSPLQQQSSPLIDGGGPEGSIRRIPASGPTKHFLGDLLPNTAYSTQVRPVYPHEGGAWSNPQYFVTLPLLASDVGRVGETFVAVEWERGPQASTYDCMQGRSQVAVTSMKKRLEILRHRALTGGGGGGIDEVDVASRSGSERQPPGGNSTRSNSAEMDGDGDEPIDLHHLELDEDDDDEDAQQSSLAATSNPSPPVPNGPPTNPLDATSSGQSIVQEIADLEARIKQAMFLSGMQLREVEQETVYAGGSDVQYELVIQNTTTTNNNGAATTSESTAATSGGSSRFTFRKVLGAGERVCRVEGLQPETTYEATVRALRSLPEDGADLATFDRKWMTAIWDEEEEDLAADTTAAAGSDQNNTEFNNVEVQAASKPTPPPTDQLLTPWTEWSLKTTFVTLKPIVVKTRCVGSVCSIIEWDTGNVAHHTTTTPSPAGSTAASPQSGTVPTSIAASATTPTTSTSNNKTAISRFQVHLSDGIGSAKTREVITLEDPTLRELVIERLDPNTIYTVTVRVCYDQDKWGVWSDVVTFVTLPALHAKLQSVAERQLELLVWRGEQTAPPAGEEVIVWCPPLTEHQLSINGKSCTQPFSLEAGTSTLLTLDSLSVDTEYTVAVQDKVLSHWQPWRDVLVCETITQGPDRPILKERRGTSISIAWDHNTRLQSRQYVYMVEVAVQQDAEKLKRSLASVKRTLGGSHDSSSRPIRHGQFEVLGYTEACEFRVELPVPIHHCYFRVQCCKTNQTMAGVPIPAYRSDLHDPQSIQIEAPAQYVWSKPTPVAHFKTPSVPGNPTGLRISNLTHNAAMLRWNVPANFNEHTDIIYRVFLNNSYQAKFTCIAETSDTHLRLTDLITNCHYRVSVTADSCMGTSVNNNTLHFSTKVVDKQVIDSVVFAASSSANNGGGVFARRLPNKKEKAPSTTLPPRRVLYASESVVTSARAHSPHQSEAFAPLLDDTASSAMAAAWGRPSSERSLQGSVQQQQQSSSGPTLTSRPGRLPPIL